MSAVAGSFELEESEDARVLALVVPRGYRGETAPSADLAYRRSVGCAACIGKGCRSCSGVGWHVEDATLTVHFPKGAAPGRRIPHAGRGDVREPGARQGDVVVEIVEDDERARVLREAQRAHETMLDELWQFQRDERLSSKARRVRALCVIAIMALGGVGFFVIRDLGKRDIGESCAGPSECRSHHCDAFFPTTSAGPARRICTDACTSDADCSPSTSCLTVTRHDPNAPMIEASFVAGHRRCAPRE